MASADDDFHVSLDGGTEKGAKAPKIDVQDGVLDIVQTDSEENTVSENISIATKSGEVNISGLGEQTNAGISTSSGDIGISYKTQPQNLSFKISSGSDDGSVRLADASYTTETSACKQGKIGDGSYSLTVNSDSGTVVVH